MAGAPRKAVTPVQVVELDGTTRRARPDRLVTEEPLEVRIHGPGEAPVPVAVTMRTPGQDFELAVGLCHSEGLVDGAGDVASVAYCLAGEGEQHYNVVTVASRRPVAAAVRARPLAATSGCGVCGKATLDDLEVRCAPVPPGGPVASSVLRALPDRLAAAQRVFDETGGLHAAARFRAAGDLVAVREDVGRHNALDKLVGHALLRGELPLGDEIVLVSGRLGYELVQKAAMAGVPTLCAVSAPSSLAVRTAARFGITLVGFLRGERFVAYAGEERIDATAPAAPAGAPRASA